MCSVELHTAFSLIFSFMIVCGQTFLSPTLPKAGEIPSRCQSSALPPAVQDRLKAEYDSWKIQEPSNLSQRARERWESEKPLECPGIAIGQFQGTENSHAFLLVARNRSSAAYRFLQSQRRRAKWRARSSRTVRQWRSERCFYSQHRYPKVFRRRIKEDST